MCERPVAAASSGMALRTSHPLVDISGTTGEPDPLCLALDEKIHDVRIDEVHFTQIEHGAMSTVLLKGAAQISQMLQADSSAQGQRCSFSLY